MWVAVEKDGTEQISTRKGKREEDGFWSFISDNMRIPKGTIKKLLGRELSWEDEPIEILGYD